MVDPSCALLLVFEYVVWSSFREVLGTNEYVDFLLVLLIEPVVLSKRTPDVENDICLWVVVTSVVDSVVMSSPLKVTGCIRLATYVHTKSKSTNITLRFKLSNIVKEKNISSLLSTVLHVFYFILNIILQ